jgi:hypothetical protein
VPKVIDFQQAKKLRETLAESQQNLLEIAKQYRVPIQLMGLEIQKQIQDKYAGLSPDLMSGPWSAILVGSFFARTAAEWYNQVSSTHLQGVNGNNEPYDIKLSPQVVEQLATLLFSDYIKADQKKRQLEDQAWAGTYVEALKESELLAAATKKAQNLKIGQSE